MAACGSLHHIFDKVRLPENPTLIEALSLWNQIKSAKPTIDDSSFTEIFGELHFKETSDPSSHSSLTPFSSSSSSSSTIDSQALKEETKIKRESPPTRGHTSSPSYGARNGGFSAMKVESLQLCTEGLGSESSDDVEDSRCKTNGDYGGNGEGQNEGKSSDNQIGELRKSRSPGRSFPPPISCIGKSGKSWVSFRSYRQNGRFVLKEIRVPSQEFLQASRENGRLKLQIVQPDDDERTKEEENKEEEEEDTEYEEEEEEENESNHDEEESCS